MSNLLHGIYRQLNELPGSSEPIKDLLRKIQSTSDEAKKEINCSGPKADLCRFLKIAVDSGYAQTSQVEELLWELEEVGHQYILLLTPAPKEATQKDVVELSASSVAPKLFDEQDYTKLLPRYEYPTSGYMWADFRPQIGGGWIAKAYGREEVIENMGVIDTDAIDLNTYHEVRKFVRKEVRAVLVARWRPQRQILEIRIDNAGAQGKDSFEERRRAIWELLSNACASSDFIGVDIEKVLNKLIFERGTPENKQRYSISRVELMDSRSGQIQIISSGSEAIDNEQGRADSLKYIGKQSFHPSLARIEWKRGVEGCPDSMREPIDIVLQKTKHGPELRILKRLTSETYEYLFDQLRSRL